MKCCLNLFEPYECASYFQATGHAAKVVGFLKQRPKNAFSEQEMQNIPLLAKCMSFIMKRGQKAKAARTLNTVLKLLQGLSPQNKDCAIHMIHLAIHNVKPAFELRKARFGGRTQFIPATLPVHKQEKTKHFELLYKLHEPNTKKHLIQINITTCILLHIFLHKKYMTRINIKELHARQNTAYINKPK